MIFSLRNLSKMLQHIALKARIPSFTTEKLHRFKFYQNWCRTTSICARQPQSVQGNLNLCRATSICAKQPQSVQNNLNSCKTTSIRAEKKKQKVTAYFRGIKWIYELKIFSLARGYIEIRPFAKKLGEKCQEQPQQWPKQSAPPHIEGRHPMLYFNIQRTEKYSIAMCYNNHGSMLHFSVLWMLKYSIGWRLELESLKV